MRATRPWWPWQLRRNLAGSENHKNKDKRRTIPMEFWSVAFPSFCLLAQLHPQPRVATPSLRMTSAQVLRKLFAHAALNRFDMGSRGGPEVAASSMRATRPWWPWQLRRNLAGSENHKNKDKRRTIPIRRTKVLASWRFKRKFVMRPAREGRKDWLIMDSP